MGSRRHALLLSQSLGWGVHPKPFQRIRSSSCNQMLLQMQPLWHHTTGVNGEWLIPAFLPVTQTTPSPEGTKGQKVSPRTAVAPPSLAHVSHTARLLLLLQPQPLLLQPPPLLFLPSEPLLLFSPASLLLLLQTLSLLLFTPPSLLLLLPTKRRAERMSPMQRILFKDNFRLYFTAKMDTTFSENYAAISKSEMHTLILRSRSHNPRDPSNDNHCCTARGQVPLVRCSSRRDDVPTPLTHARSTASFSLTQLAVVASTVVRSPGEGHATQAETAYSHHYVLRAQHSDGKQKQPANLEGNKLPIPKCHAAIKEGYNEWPNV